MSSHFQSIEAARGADVLVRDHFRVKPGECLVLTIDTMSDMAAAGAIMSAASAAGAKPVLAMVPRLPFQGKLADPYVPDALAEAVVNCDVWFDMTFPYLAGSAVHDRAMQAKRCRYLLLADLTAPGLHRLYGTAPLDQVFEVQQAFDAYVAAREGAECRITNPAGTDVTFTLGRTVTKKSRHTEQPGTSTIMGSGIFYPVPDTVRGEIRVEATFHEFYGMLPQPMCLVVDGKIREIRDGGAHTPVMDRALRRAGGGDYGRVIHFTCGFHPAAQFTGASFIEDIRAMGANAIGLGVPWWEPGGGENHPDAVLSQQSLWIDGQQLVRDGMLTGLPAAT